VTFCPAKGSSLSFWLLEGVVSAIGFYFITNRYFGWWQPSESLTDPNILGTALPALGPIGAALQAGSLARYDLATTGKQHGYAAAKIDQFRSFSERCALSYR
jgi:hypothetical protein